MKLLRLIELARAGELAVLSDVAKTDEKVVGYINRALVEIYNKYPLKTEEAIVTVQDNVHIYTLDGSDTNVSGIGEDDLIQITDIYDAEGRLPLNNDDDPFSVYTIGYDTIQLSKAEDGMYLSVIYRAGHTWIDYATIDGATDDVDVRIPRGLTNAVLKYVAYLAYDALDDGQSVKAEKYLARYREALALAEQQGLVPSDMPSRGVDNGGFL